MLMKTGSSHPFAPLLSRRQLAPVSVLALATLAASAIVWTFVAGPRVAPLLAGFSLLGLVALCVLWLAQRGSSLERRLAAEAAHELESMRRTDADLRAAIARHQSILESLSGGFVIVDRLDRYIHVSSGAARVLGRPSLRLGETITSTLSEEEAPDFHEVYRRAKATRTPEEFELPCGEGQRWLSMRIHPSSDTTTVFFRDVTEQRRALERVRETEDSFRLFAENVQDLFWVIDIPARRPVYTSPSWERLTGLSLTELRERPRSALELVHPDDRQRVCEHLLRCGADADSRRCEIEFRILRRDGELRWIHQSSVAQHDPKGRVTRISGLASDVTARKQMEASLRESEARFRSLSQSSPVGIFRTDLAYRIIDVNARLLEICALPGRVAGSSLLDLVHFDDRDQVLSQWRRVEQEGTWECRVGVVKGALRTVLMRVALERSAEGEPVGYIGTISDLTEYREVQTRLAMSERMASLGTLAAGVGHEINNPLTYLMCNLELAQRNVEKVFAKLAPGDERVARTADFLRIAFEGSCRIRDIVRELRVFARAESEQIGPVDALTCVEAALNIALNQVRHRARIVKKLSPIPKVRADETRLGQVFLNLIVNAAQAIPEGHADDNQITIASYLEEESSRVVLEISDTGLGISPELLSRIFDPFFTTKSVGEGTGLGLFLAQQAIRSYGGAIHVESEPGKGSTFRVFLGISNEDTARKDASRAKPAPKKARAARILVIDDEREVGQAVAALLEAEHEVTTVEHAADALKLLLESRFDLVLCDLMMPTMSANDFYRELKQASPEHARRVCFMTGGVFTDGARAFLAEVQRPLINKPFSLAGLRAMVAQSLAEAGKLSSPKRATKRKPVSV